MMIYDSNMLKYNFWNKARSLAAGGVILLCGGVRLSYWFLLVGVSTPVPVCIFFFCFIGFESRHNSQTYNSQPIFLHMAAFLRL